MAKRSRTTSLLRVTLYGILPVVFFTNFIIAGTMVLSYTLYLAKPIPRKFAIGMAIVMSTLIAIGMVVALIIHMCKGEPRAPRAVVLRPRFSDPSLISQDRPQQEKPLIMPGVSFPLPARISPPRQAQRFPYDLTATSTRSEPTVPEQGQPYDRENLAVNHQNPHLDLGDSPNDFEQPPAALKYNRFHPNPAILPNQPQDPTQDNTFYAQIPRPLNSHHESIPFNFYPSPLVPRRTYDQTSGHESIPNSLKSGLANAEPEREESLKKLHVLGRIERASVGNPKQRGEEEVERRWAHHTRPKRILDGRGRGDRHHDWGLGLGIGIGIGNGAAEGGAPRKQESGEETRYYTEIGTADLAGEAAVDRKQPGDGEKVKEKGRKDRKGTTKKVRQKHGQEQRQNQDQPQHDSFPPVDQRIEDNEWGQRRRIP